MQLHQPMSLNPPHSRYAEIFGTHIFTHITTPFANQTLFTINSLFYYNVNSFSLYYPHRELSKSWETQMINEEGAMDGLYINKIHPLSLSNHPFFLSNAKEGFLARVLQGVLQGVNEKGGSAHATIAWELMNIKSERCTWTGCATNF